MGKKFIISDLDGTLLDHAKGISPKYVKILNNLISEGLDFSIATGRDMKNSLKAIKDLNLKYPAILTNGALMADLKNEKYMKITQLNRNLVKKIMKLSKKYNLQPMVFAAFNKKEKKIYYEKGSWGSKNIKPLLKKQINPLKEMEVVSIQFHTFKEKLDPFLNKLQKEIGDDITLIYIEDVSYRQIGIDGEWYWLEINSNEAGKEKMLRYFAKKIGISLNDFVVFGDNHNDIGMLKAVGMGIAMENSPEEVKNVADAITLPNYEGGVVKYILEHRDEFI